MTRSGAPWSWPLPPTWVTTPLFTVGRESRVRNHGLVEENLLSLSYGRIVRKDLHASEGLLPESFETYQIVEADDLVFRFTDLQNDKRSLRSGRVPERGIITSAYMAFTPTKIEPRFFEYQMRGYDTSKVFYGMGGGLRQSLKFDDVRRMPVVLPPLNEQRAIADYLDRETAEIDLLIEKQTALIDRLRERRSHTIAHAVTPADAPVDRCLALKRVLLRVEQGISPDTSTGDDEAAVWVLKAGASNRGLFDELESKPVPETITVPNGIEVKSGDLIASRASGSPSLVGSVARVGKLSRRLILSDKNFRLVPGPSSDARYLYWAMNSPSFRSQVLLAISGADGLANNLPLASLRRMRIWLPAMSEQRAIADHLDCEMARIDELITKTERFIELTKERRSALITAAVTGQVDVSTKAGVA